MRLHAKGWTPTSSLASNPTLVADRGDGSMRWDSSGLSPKQNLQPEKRSVVYGTRADRAIATVSSRPQGSSTVTQRAVLFAQEGGSVTRDLGEALKGASIEVTSAGSREQLVQLVSSLSPSFAVVLYAAVVDDETLKTVELVRRIDRSCPLLIMASSISTQAAISAMRAGASDLLEMSA